MQVLLILWRTALQPEGAGFSDFVCQKLVNTGGELFCLG